MGDLMPMSRASWAISLKPTSRATRTVTLLMLWAKAERSVMSAPLKVPLALVGRQCSISCFSSLYTNVSIYSSRRRSQGTSPRSIAMAYTKSLNVEPG